MRKPTRPPGGGARRARAPRALAAAAPAAVAGRPALQRVGDRGRRRDRARRHRHARAGLARPPRARARAGRLRLEHVRLLVCTHAHADHCGQAHPIADRAGCELWVHPNHEHFSAYADDPEAAHAPPASRSRARAACRRTRRTAGARSPPARSHPDRDLLPGARRRDRPRHLVGARDARPRAVARLPLPARAAAADLRRPPARPRLAVLRLRLHARTRWASSSARSTRSSALGARLALSGHGRPFTDVQEHIDGQPAARRSSASTRCRAALAGRAVDRLRPRCRRVYGEELRPRVAGWLLTKVALLPHASRGARGGRAPARASRSAGLRSSAHADRRADRRRATGPSFSFEFFPPKTEEGDAQPRGGAGGALARWTRRSSRSPTAPAARRPRRSRRSTSSRT